MLTGKQFYIRHIDRCSGLALLTLCFITSAHTAFAAPLARTVIIVPASAPSVVNLAAKELQHYVEKSTGTQMPIVTENNASSTNARRIYLGATKAALNASIDVTKLPRDAYRIKTAGNVAYLAGSDREGDPLNLDTAAGTLFAVYDVLDNDMGVRWLWPGQSGELIPKRAALTIRDQNKTVLPRFRFCSMRTERSEEKLWMRRMRMHGADSFQYSHAFGAWAEKYGAEHPDWFEMDPKGVRRPGRSMCVSNPGFQKQIVENWWAERIKDPGSRSLVNICENDGPGACSCPNCLAWDGPTPPWPRPTPYDNVHNVSRRYARFAMAVLGLARKHDPDAEVVTYAYSNIIFDPGNTKLDKNVIVGYVPDVFFPRTPESQAWVLRQWAGWRKAGASMFMRPNYLLHGYCMPVNWVHQLAEEFQYCEQNGMIGTDYDSLTGMWSTMGLPLYVCGRLHVTPRAPVDRILSEYYSSFGPAARQVKSYWDYWERYSLDHINVFKDGLWHYARYPETAYKRFPLESFAPAEKIMAEAERVAAKDRDAAIKIAFLKAGLQHAKLCVQASIDFSQAGEDQTKQKAAVEALLAFRKTIADPMVINKSDGDDSCRAREVNLGWPE